MMRYVFHAIRTMAMEKLLWMCWWRALFFSSFRVTEFLYRKILFPSRSVSFDGSPFLNCAHPFCGLAAAYGRWYIHICVRRVDEDDPPIHRWNRNEDEEEEEKLEEKKLFPQTRKRKWSHRIERKNDCESYVECLKKKVNASALTIKSESKRENRYGRAFGSLCVVHSHFPAVQLVFRSRRSERTNERNEKKKFIWDDSAMVTAL